MFAGLIEGMALDLHLRGSVRRHSTERVGVRVVASLHLRGFFGLTALPGLDAGLEGDWIHMGKVGSITDIKPLN